MHVAIVILVAIDIGSVLGKGCHSLFVDVFRMLEDFEMDLVLTQNFYYFFNEHCKSNRDLLFRMSALDRNKVWLLSHVYLMKLN